MVVTTEQPCITVLLQWGFRKRRGRTAGAAVSTAGTRTAERQKGSETAWVASQMGARAGKYQPMGSQSTGWGNRRQAGEVSNAVPGPL